MRPLDLIVAVGDHHERAQRIESPRQQANRVERGLIRPMKVLQHEDHWPGSGVGADEARPRHRQFELHCGRSDVLQRVSRDGDPCGEGQGMKRVVDGRFVR